LAVFSLIAVFSAVAASAHAILVASQPPEGGTVPTGEAHFNLRFNSRIDRMRSRVVLTSPDHTQITMPILAEGKPDEINASATLVPGAYVLRWQVLAIDGHITRGDIAFTAGP